jgi:hypothetical protein
VVAKADPLLRQAIERRHVVTGGNRQVEPRLITYYQNDVQRAVRWPRRGRDMGAGEAARCRVGVCCRSMAPGPCIAVAATAPAAAPRPSSPAPPSRCRRLTRPAPGPPGPGGVGGSSGCSVT